MLTTEAPAAAAASPDSDEWVPPWWGTDEENAKEAQAFAAWTRSIQGRKQ